MNYINGPINVVRMEGKINDIPKVIYLYMDYHSNIDWQLQCEELSIDVHYHISDNIKKIKSNKTVDFFAEIQPSEINIKDTDYRGRYIDEINRFFKKNIKIDVTKKQNKSSQKSSQNDKIRYHYIDIRDVLRNNVYYFTDKMIQISKDALYHDTLPNIKNIHIYIDKINVILDILYKFTFEKYEYDPKKHKLENKEYNETLSLVYYYITKILYKYNNKNIQNDILSYLDLYIKPDFKIVFKIINEIIKLLKDMEKIDNNYRILKSDYDEYYGTNYNYTVITTKIREQLFYLDKLFHDLSQYIIYLYSKYVDIFFLRRFLDKNYITNVVTYTGAAHSLVYIDVLAKYYDFKITHISYNALNDIDTLNKEIKSTKKYNDLHKLLFPKYLTQCSNIKDFPEGFN